MSPAIAAIDNRNRCRRWLVYLKHDSGTRRSKRETGRNWGDDDRGAESLRTGRTGARTDRGRRLVGIPRRFVLSLLKETKGVGGEGMKRREFVMLLAGATAWPCTWSWTARAQQSD